MRDDDLMPDAIVSLLRTPWDGLLAEIHAALTGNGWLARHLTDIADPGDAPVFMETVTLDQAVLAVYQAVENTSAWDGSDERDSWHRFRIHADLQAVADLLHQAEITAAATALDPVPRSTAAHALLAGGVFQLRQACSAYRFWQHEKGRAAGNGRRGALR